ncbi:hypothetical protein EYF80_018470 [Liparis tanakae]|uniref:Uncharacterized protein n=1 Tax=Liparis tanakae TaxID=230148 RepID=A0A4Z2I051_9TELE|nr:hypothetical protein EYF80_018470 [Liparis tanakae]
MLRFFTSLPPTESLKCRNIPSSAACPRAARRGPSSLIRSAPPRVLHVFTVSPCVSEPRSLRAPDALEATEAPAFLQTGADAGQLLSEGAGQPGEKSLHLAGVNL